MSVLAYSLRALFLCVMSCLMLSGSVFKGLYFGRCFEDTMIAWFIWCCKEATVSSMSSVVLMVRMGVCSVSLKVSQCVISCVVCSCCGVTCSWIITG